ncbi:hypothetical protein BGZ76_010627 [Entomortierella beljakovae]|nr:hypothetical protein BGZ76_010627 [Entomortierella beljakovae]
MNQSPSLSAGSNDTKTRNVVKKKAVKKVPDEWFASRKLDGVRCLTRINRITGDIETLSRRGRHFDNLTVTREALRQILSSSNGSDTSHTKGFDSKNWELFFRQTLGIKSSASDKEVPEEIYLDGEICIFKGSISDSANESAKNKKSNLIGENVEIIGGDNREDKLGREDFQKALSIAKRKGSLGSDKDSEDSEDSKVRDDMTDLAGESSLTETDIPVYCIFDCITDKEFTDCAGSRPFRSRIQGIAKTLSSRVTGKDNTQLYNSSTIRTLRHIKIENAAQLDKLVDMSVRLDWEGVMLRKNCGYEGKRSRNMLKIKKFLDAEYVVQEAMVGSMRVPIDGEFKECDNILTKVIIEHRGNKVGVGSGFSMEDRVKFGKDPSLIVGKTISVQYFEESCTTITGGNSNKVGSEDNLTSDKKEWSLRFPTVKAIYGIGPRDI